MTKNTPSTDRPNPPASRPSVILDKETARYIFRALLLTIVFAWALINLQAVLQFLGRVLAVFSPFLMGGAIAFVINILLCPLERIWQRICKKAPDKLTRPVCLTLSTLLVLGILFAVVFMMLPMNLCAICQATPKSWGIGGQERCSLLQNTGSFYRNMRWIPIC
mgnify:CR=1 FL=1